MALGCSHGRVEIESVEGIARRGLDQQERRRRDEEHEQHGEQHAAEQVVQEPAVHDGPYRETASVSALHSR